MRHTFTDRTRVEHWNHAGECILLDLSDVWSDTFCKWDALVPTDTASAIATAVVRELEKLADRED